MKKTFVLCALSAVGGALAVWLVAPSRGEDSRRADAVAVGNGYSVVLKVKPAHPFLAEYDEVLEIFGGTAREGKFMGRLSLPMNMGGRVRILLFRSRGEGSAQIQLKDRYASSLIDLPTLKTSGAGEVKEDDFAFLRAFSGEAHPLKFIPAAVWEKMSKAERGG